MFSLKLKMLLVPSLLFLLAIGSLANAAGAASPKGSCSAKCPGTTGVSVDLAEQCMCLSGGEGCFEIGIGAQGPSQTSSGTGKMHEAQGEKYQTKMGVDTSTRYDKDAIATGIPGNDSVGKWIHKPRNCAPAKSYGTKGCIAVDCENWPLIKKEFQMGSSITICNGGSGGGGGKRKHKAEQSEDEELDRVDTRAKTTNFENGKPVVTPGARKEETPASR